ncbi:multidrug effflux MFS transporter [Pelagibius litoralis]|uniref:Bcr/CflA family efflux transporter n=2 Tax=Pelagibius litoralis TaxID=374515 RepID=A0A967EUR0_9PROT|nr:multidrug effflux MFS transporter [Pelagibius litoralis]
MSKSPLSRTEFVALLSLTTSLTALSIDAILPALQAIGQAFTVANANDTQFIVTLFILGMVFGEILFGPLSDAIGRKRAILAGLLIYCIGTLVAMAAFSFEQVIIGRIIQGIGVSGPKIASRALIRDLYEGRAMARIMSFIFMVFILVPMLAPALGQGVMLVAGWRAIFILFLVLAAVVALWLGLRQPETLTPERRIRLSPSTLFSNAVLIVRHAKVMAYTLSAGLIFGALLLYVSTAQAIFIDLYDAGDRFPLYFAMLASGVGVASFSNGQLVMRYGMHRLTVIALGGLIFFAGALLVVASQTEGIPSFPVFMGLFFLMFFNFGLLFGNLNAMAMESLGRVAGLGASVIASVSSLLAVALSVSVGRFYDQTVIPLAVGFILAGALSLVLVLAANRSSAGEV